ncbi:glycoside hydrolase family 15 protein [Candidatus Woesearchaeota archaeon]|nr:glycoside hydrolase family 15 protein [Nanoarchaeota archaeon]MCB9371143.1 glycoside hydrolase family 15 protein [Candidatus Woesearchaeota archaeon]USN43862.1 MAG: glycoside hydrolase family 15 protein [Candidatus Woesearchaeota archaeon]
MSLDYSIIGNCKTAALIDKDASVRWLCFPNFDSPSVFASLLDDELGGVFAIYPLGIGFYYSKQQYLKDTNVVETVFYNEHHSFKIVDFFPRYKDKNGNVVVKNILVRYIKVLYGKPAVRIVFKPKPDYARGKNNIETTDTTISVSNKSGDTVHLTTNLSTKDLVQSKRQIIEGEYFCAVSYNESFEKLRLRDIRDYMKKTTDYWKQYIKDITIPKQYQVSIKRSVLTLKLLTYEETGAVIAAATTSLPEAIGSQRNWDYRYCWLRDSSFTINALTRVYKFEEAVNYMNFLKNKVFDPKHYVDGKLDLKIMYGINGERYVQEEELWHLKGYKQSVPVRIGNEAFSQKQIDVVGEVIDSLYEFYVRYKYAKELDSQIWEIVKSLVDYVEEHWMDKDCGIWEFRGKLEHFTFSKLLCWVAIDKAIKLSQHFEKTDMDIERWKNLRTEIRNSIMENAYNEEKQAFTMYYGSTDLDASVLLMPYYNFISGKDPKMISTLEAMERELLSDCMMKRYTIIDDSGKTENAFSICTFWYIDALYMSGQETKAKTLFRHILQYANANGLFSEDIDLHTKELTGNFPQAYTHIAIINTAILLSKKKDLKPEQAKYRVNTLKKKTTRD